MKEIKRVSYAHPDFQVEVDWILTHRCNYSCSYCRSYDNSKPFLFKTVEQYSKAFEYLNKYFGGNMSMYINILGGEPTLFKKWYLLMNYMGKNNIVPKLTTNLAVPVDTYIDKLDEKLPPFINGSYHPEFADLDTFCYNAEKLKERGFLKNLSLLADPTNWDRTIKIHNRLKKIAPSMNLTKIKNEFTGTLSITEGYIDYTDDQLKLLDEGNTSEDKYTTVEFKDGTVIHPSQFLLKTKYNKFKGMKCYVGKYRLHINANGDVFPSACLLNNRRAIMGNIFKENVRRIERPIICPFNACLCGPDTRIEKERKSDVTKTAELRS